jgi:hypothetical protein
MTTSPGSPHILRGGLVLPDPATSAVMRVIVPLHGASEGGRP